MLGSSQQAQQNIINIRLTLSHGLCLELGKRTTWLFLQGLLPQMPAHLFGKTNFGLKVLWVDCCHPFSSGSPD